MNETELKKMVEEGELAQDRILPNDIDSELAFLGSILIEPDSFSKVADFIRSEDFYRKAHGIIFEAMIELYLDNEPIDILSLASRLDRKGALDSIGGKAFLAKLAHWVPTSANINHYAKIIYEKKILRDLITTAYKIIDRSFRSKEKTEKILDEAESLIFSIAQRSYTKTFQELGPFLKEAFERIEELHKEKGRAFRGVPSGFVDLDNLLGGFQKSDLIIIGARPSLGKTAFAINIARNVALRYKKVVGIFSLEMSKDQVIDRFLAQEANVNLWKLRTGQLSKKGDFNDFLRLQTALGNLYESPIYIDDGPSTNILQMRGMARRLKAEKNLDLIIVDYLQLMQPVTPKDNEVQQISEISRGLKALARELEVPVIAISQLSRRIEQRGDQIPRLSDLRQSGSLEQDSDVVIFLNRKIKEESSSNIAEIIIAKHRNGPTGKVKLFFDSDTVSFESLAERREE